MQSKSKVAVIDVGSNSIKVLIAARNPNDQTISTLHSETIETRISAGISREHPELTNSSMQAGCETIAKLIGIAREHGANKIQMVATSAVRDAINGQAFCQLVESQTKIPLRTLSGTEEATYIGKGLSCEPALKNTADFFQFDLGGGSLELIRFKNHQIQQAISLPLGVVRITEQYIKDIQAPVAVATQSIILQYVKQQLVNSNFDFAPNEAPCIATGGAIVMTRAIIAEQNQRPLTDESPRISHNAISLLQRQLCESSLQERLQIKCLPPSRADIMPASLIIQSALLQISARPTYLHSFYNLRYGIALEMLD